MVFVETPVFTGLLSAALADRDYAEFQVFLADKPDAGSLIVGGGGIRKVRWRLPGSGKRGGLRVIYYWRTTHDQIYLLYLFAKNARSDLTREQVKQLASLARELK
jgi:hypothetical protein